MIEWEMEMRWGRDRMQSHMYSLLCSSAISAFAIGISSVAHAQTSSAPADDSESGSPAGPIAPDEAAVSSEGAILVTGSRTIRNGNESPSPLTVMQTAELQKVQPGILSEALNVLPVFAGSRTTASNPVVNVAVSGGNSSSSGLNLRNLGPQRTLILMDGNRVPPTSFNNAVDVDIVPQMLVQRVEVVTGGVSAVYGSDAVAGVVNYILDKNFNGLRIEAETGLSERGDAARQVLGIAAGTDLFGGRGHFEASYQFINQDGIPRRSDRDWLDLPGVTGLGTADNPYVLQTNIRQAGLPFGGLITGAPSAANPLGGQTFIRDGVLAPFVNGVATGSPELQVGGGGGYHDTSLIAALRAHQVFARFDYDFTNDLRGFVQASGNFKTNRLTGDAISLSNVVMSSSNPFLPQRYRADLAAAGQETFRFSQLMGPHTGYRAVPKTDQRVFLAGLEGRLGEFDWSTVASYSIAELNTVIENNPNRQNLFAALDAVRDPATGEIVCNASLADPAYADCVPLNVFGPTAQSSRALAYVAPRTSYVADTKLLNFSAQVTGSPVSLPAGEVTVALSGEWRKLTFEADTTASATELRDCANMRFNCSPTQSAWTFSFANSDKVSQEVAEGAFEVNVPLLEDLPLVQSLSVSGAARYTHYDTSGNYVTWKVSGDWRVNDYIRFRATRSRDIRAPTLYELFRPANPSPVAPPDLLTGLRLTVPSTGRANPDLKAEIANTLTGGVVITPMRGLSLSVDAYKISISDAISYITGSTPALQQLCYESSGSSIWCTFQDRALGNYTDTSPDNRVTQWYTQYLNIAEIDTHGIDLEANYSTSQFGRPASLRFLASYQPKSLYVQEGAPSVDYAGVAFGPPDSGAPQPVWRLSGFVQFQPLERLTVNLLGRWRDAMRLSGETSQVWVNNRIASFGTVNATITYDIPDPRADAQIYLTVSNLFDATPPLGAYSANGARSGQRDGFVLGDDVIGRAYTLGARISF